MVTWAIMGIYTGHLHPSGWPEVCRQSAGIFLSIITILLAFVGFVDSFAPRRYDDGGGDDE